MIEKTGKLGSRFFLAPVTILQINMEDLVACFQSMTQRPHLEIWELHKNTEFVFISHHLCIMLVIYSGLVRPYNSFLCIDVATYIT